MRFELFALALVYLTLVSCDDGLRIQTLNGPVQGVQLNFNSSYQLESDPQQVKYSINAWKGIPFAEPPVGDLRFKRPVPIPSWTEVINATSFEPDCFNTNPVNRISEDCLYLNIWAPLNASNAAVMVIK